MTSSDGSERLHVAFLNSWYEDSARGSGTATAITGLAEGLASLGHRVTLVRPKKSRLPFFLGRLMYNLGLGRRLSGNSFDLILGFDLDGCFYRPGPRQPYAVCLKGVSAEEMTFERGWPRLLLWTHSLLERRNARRAERVLVISEYNRRAAIEAYGLEPEKVSVVPEGISLTDWAPLQAEPPPRTDPRPAILTVAHQYPRKNTKTILAAIPAVRAAVPQARLRIVGGGPMLPSLRGMVKELGLEEAVGFLGTVPRDVDVRREYFGADVFCLPSLQEGFGIVFLEAMAAGLPIVASTAAAIPEVAPDGEVAILVPPLDAEALAGAIIRLLKDPVLRARLGAIGQERVRGYDFPAVAQKCLAAALKGEERNIHAYR